MTQTFHAPPPGTVFRDDPYGHALIEHYMPWLMAHCGDEPFILSSDGRPLYPRVFEKRKYLPWTVQCTDSAFATYFTQDAELPMAVPPIGTDFDDIDNRAFIAQYPDFHKYLLTLYSCDTSEHQWHTRVERTDSGRNRIIAHPPHSVVVPFVEPVEAETETPEPSEQEAHLFPTLESVDDCLNAIVEKLLSAKKDLIFLTETLGSEKPNLQKPF